MNSQMIDGLLEIIEKCEKEGIKTIKNLMTKLEKSKSFIDMEMYHFINDEEQIQEALNQYFTLIKLSFFKNNKQQLLSMLIESLY